MSFTLTFDLSGFEGLPNSTRIIYTNQWNTYNRIQTLNAGVSTIRGSGDKSATYYQYLTNAEQLEFLNGQMLHIRRYPLSNWARISED